MANIERTIKYTCDNDCKMSGCPGHQANLTYQSTSDIVHWIDGKGQDAYFDLNQLTAFLTLLRNCNRVEIDSCFTKSIKESK